MTQRLFVDGQQIALGRAVEAWISGLRRVGVGPQSRVLVFPSDPAAFVALYEACRRLDAVPVISTFPIDEPEIPASIAAVVGAHPETIRPGRGTTAAPGSARVILQTSGSTGVPKYVLQTKAAVDYQTACIIECLGYRDGTGFLLALPPWSAYGLTVVHAWQTLDASLHLVTSLMPRRLVPLFESGAIDFVDGTPQLYELLRRHLARTGAEVLRPVSAWCCGGDALAPALARDWEALSGKPLLDGYGSSEAGGNIAINGPGRHRHGTVGVAYPGTEIRIAADGEVLVRSPSVSACVTLDDLFAEPTPPDWLATGDLGLCDDDGYLSITGRKNNLIAINGYKISPEHVERVVLEFSGVARCVVRGVRDAEGVVREIAAELVCDGVPPSTRALREHCRSRLPAWAVPHRFEAVDGVTYNRNGKVQRPRPEVQP